MHQRTHMYGGLGPAFCADPSSPWLPPPISEPSRAPLSVSWTPTFCSLLFFFSPPPRSLWGLLYPILISPRLDCPKLVMPYVAPLYVHVCMGARECYPTNSVTNFIKIVRTP